MARPIPWEAPVTRAMREALEVAGWNKDKFCKLLKSCSGGVGRVPA